MDTERFYSRGEVQALAKVDTGTFTFWLKHDLVRPEEPGVGKGTRFRFAREQVLIAALLATARNAALNIDALRAISDRFQEAVAVFRRTSINPDLLTEVIGQVEHPGTLAEEIENLAGVIERSNGPVRERLIGLLGRRQQEGYGEKIAAAAQRVAEPDLPSLWLMVMLFDADGLLIVQRDPASDAWMVRGVGAFDESYLKAGYAIIFDLSKTGALNWSEVDR